jgi:DNA-binding FrmR family transcriptional regulator
MRISLFAFVIISIQEERTMAKKSPRREAPRHHTHRAIVSRLRRAEGHLGTIIEMIEEGRDCLELAQQLQAVENAIDNAKKTLIHDHIDHCLERSLNASGAKARAAFTEFKAITKYL